MWRRLASAAFDEPRFASAVERRAWQTRWALTSAAAATVATALDALLLQRSRAYFTGGFLAADTLTTPGQVAAFLGGSWLADFGVAGIVTAFVLWLTLRLGVGRLAGALAVCVALIPVVATDFVEYRLASYLGDAFDLRLMFDLAGRDVGEVVAVSSDHLTSIAVGAVLVLAGAVPVALWVRRRAGVGYPVPTLPRAMAMPLLVLVVAAAVTTTMRRGSDELDNGIRRKPSGQWLGMLVNLASDVDGDGFGLLGRPPDGSLFDAAVRPYAADLPGNGVDENGAAGDLPSAEPVYRENAAAPPSWPSRRDVVMIVLESFRADALGARQGGVAVTPVLDELARRGVSSSAAYSHNGYTVQARHHLFSGSLADLRGRSSLIDDFKANGYETAYFSGQDESFGGVAFGVGFDRADVRYDARTDRDKRYSRFTTPGSLAVPHGLLVERVSEFLARRDRTRPLFLYVNFHDTHFPYHHDGIEPLLDSAALAQADIVPERAADLRATYLNTVANVDRAIGRVLDRTRGHLGREPGVVVVADHGESLFDEGFLGHGYALNDAQTRVPLIVANLPVTLVEPVGQTDLRDAIRDALARPGGEPPRIVRNRSRRVFQYLGNFDRPAQVKLTGLDAAIAFDFRSGRVRVNEDEWMVPDRLAAAAAADWRGLVHAWERMILARNQRHGSGS